MINEEQTIALAMSIMGSRGRGKSKVRGNSEYYRLLSRKSIRKRRKQKARRNE